MKKLVFLVMAALLLSGCAGGYKAVVKPSALPEATAMTSDDLFIITDDPLGSPVSQRLTLANLLSSIVDTDVQAYSAALASIADLTVGANGIIHTTAADTYAFLAAPGNNYFLGWNSAGAFGAYQNIQLDDSAAQFGSATVDKGTLKVLLSGSTDGALMTLASVQTEDRTLLLPDATDTLVGKATTDTMTNKTFDVDGTGNIIKQWKYLVLTHPHLCAAGAPIQTTSTSNTYGQCKFGNATDKATNYAEYYLAVPGDIDTSVDLTATFKIKLGGADTGDHEYEISFDSVADSAAYAGSLGDAVSLAYTADASGADGDVETAGETTLTGWRSAMTAGQLMVIRMARDGDHGNDTSSVDSYSGPLVIKYKSTQ